MAKKKKKQISCFNKRGKMTPEFKDIIDIAVTIQIAMYMNPEQPKLTVMMETAKRMKKSPQNRSEWRQSLLDKYLKDPKSAMVANKNTVEIYMDLSPLRDKHGDHIFAD